MLVAFVLIGLVFYVGLNMLLRYKAHSMESFCRGISPDASPASVLAQAKTMGFPAYEVIKERGVIAVLNQRSPYFRFACEVSFKDSHVEAKHVIPAD
jgi:hypothetical protein